MAKREKRTKEIRTPFDALRLISALTHGIGFWLATAGVGVLIGMAALVGNVWQVVSYSVYGASLIGLYAASTLYHCLRVSAGKRITLRKLDHMMIFLLIAGTYTPICLVTLRDHGAWGWTMFGIIWGLAITGIVVKLFWLHAPRWISTVAYIAMGWMAMIAIIPLLDTMRTIAFVWLMIGGGFYTLGGILYALRWPGRDRKWFGFHEVFHIFILLGSVSHFAMMFCL